MPESQLLFGTDYSPEPIESTVNELPGLKLPRQFELALLRGNAERLFPKFKAEPGRRVGIGIRVVTAAIVVMAALVTVSAQGRGAAHRRGRLYASAPGALFDITGYWVSLVTEDWRYRQFTPAKGDYVSIPSTRRDARSPTRGIPPRDEAAGEQCKAYGAAGVMRLPTRLHITWQDDRTPEARGRQRHADANVRLRQPQGSNGTLQGVSLASWDQPRAVRVADPEPGRSHREGRLPGKVVTDEHEARIPAQERRAVQRRCRADEYHDRFDVPGGESLLMVTAELVDPEYLTTPYWTSTHFKRQNDAAGWRPTPCSAR